MGVGAGKVRQQRRVDVEQSALPSPDEPGREDAHVATKHHQLHVRGLKLGIHEFFVGHAPLWLLNVHRQRHPDALDAGAAAVLQTTGVGLVGEH